MTAQRARFGAAVAGVSVVLAACLLGLIGRHAVAAGSPAPTSLTVDAPASVTLGQSFTITARLTSGGAPVTSRVLALDLNNVELRTDSVDANGTATLPVRSTDVMQAGVATFTIRYKGSPSLAPATRSVTIEFQPARLVIQTVPAVDNMPVTVGGVTKSTVRGQAAFPIIKLGDYQVSPQIGKASTDSMRTDFVRWSDNIYTPSRTATITGDLTLQLGVHVAYRGSFRFVNAAGQPIDSRQVQSVVLTSTGGTQVRLSSFEGVWLEAGTAVRHANGLAEVRRDWRILEVTMAGTNVVNSGQQRLAPSPNATWSVTVLLYDLQVEARDAIFGTPLSGNLTLTYPDGKATSVTLSTNAPVGFSQLPRGDYVVKLSASGIGAPTPVALSRGQTAVIRVITYTDMAVVGGVGLLFALGMVVLGRYRSMRKSSAEIATQLQRRAYPVAASMIPVATAVVGSTRDTIDHVAARVDISRHVQAARPWLEDLGGRATEARSGMRRAVEHLAAAFPDQPFGTGTNARSCTRCGSPAEDDAQFCAWCGSRLESG